MSKPTPKNLEQAEEIEINLPCRYNDKLEKIVERANYDDELKALWRMQNINAVDRKGFSDHGPVHMQIVSNIALKIGRLLFKDGKQPSLVENFTGFEKEDAEVVLAVAGMLHDVGMSVHRNHHEKNSVIIAKDVVDRLLEEVYTTTERTILRSEILHAILCHRSDSDPLTLEAGIVRVADALDMEKGRSKITFENGRVDIHSVSAAAVENVDIRPGEDVPVSIKVYLNNSAGIFQITGLLRKKLDGSGIEDFIEVEAEVDLENGEEVVEQISL